MQRLFGIILIFGAVFLFSITARAAVILVDYDDGNGGNGIHDFAVRNGGFESPDTGVDGEPFSNTDNWVNLQGAQTEEARRTNIYDTGAFSSVNATSGTKNFALDTTHTIAQGDSFDLEFRARRAYQSDASTAVTADLYYTNDNTIGGTATVLGTTTVSGMATSFSTYGFSVSSIAGGDPSIGKTLFLRFEQSAGPGFSRTDGWYLTAIPEPGTIGLLVIGITGLMSIKRRRYQ